MKKEKLRKILAIRDYNIKKEDEFPKNPDNITKDELHDHFDLDDDGKVTLDEYADHINFHCDLNIKKEVKLKRLKLGNRNIIKSMVTI